MGNKISRFINNTLEKVEEALFLLLMFSFWGMLFILFSEAFSPWL